MYPLGKWRFAPSDNHAGRDLHLVDLLFQSRIQMACRMSQRVDRFPNQDWVLERLMVEGLFDHREPDHVHIAEVWANWLSVALTDDKPQVWWTRGCVKAGVPEFNYTPKKSPVIRRSKQMRQRRVRGREYEWANRGTSKEQDSNQRPDFSVSRPS